MAASLPAEAPAFRALGGRPTRFGRRLPMPACLPPSGGILTGSVPLPPSCCTVADLLSLDDVRRLVRAERKLRSPRLAGWAVLSAVADLRP